MSRSRPFAASLAQTLAFALTAALTLTLAALASPAAAQQVDDTGYVPRVQTPAYAEGQGPQVVVDGAHYNFHTADGRYRAFAELLRRDGYVVRGSQSAFDAEMLEEVEILVIANALAEENQKSWKLPTPSAFTAQEIAAVHAWVDRGGALMLIADHMPMPGAARELARAFDVEFNNGFAFEVAARKALGGPIVFKRSDGSLVDHAITRGRSRAERVRRVTSFTGQAFQVGEDLTPLMIFRSDTLSFMPEEAWKFKPETPRIPVEGWSQGAVGSFGRGRAAFFGEAAMFTAQVSGDDRTPLGLNSPQAKDNEQLLLNILHWLGGLLPAGS